MISRPPVRLTVFSRELAVPLLPLSTLPEPAASLTAQPLAVEAASEPAAKESARAAAQSSYPWAIRATYGYFVPTQSIYGLDINPFGLAIGLQGTHSWRNGLWLGLRAEYLFGRAVSEEIESRPGRPYDGMMIQVDSNLASFSFSLGYDVDLAPFTFRYGLDLGVSLLGWDIDEPRYAELYGFEPPKGSLAGFHLVPGLGVYFPVSFLSVGLEERFRVESSEYIPAAFGTNLNLGWRFR